MGISPKQYAAMVARTQGSGNKGAAAARRESPQAIPPARLILGVDPSLRGTGWGVIRVESGVLRHCGSGTIRCPSEWERSRCLGVIAQQLRQILAEHRPEACVFEGLFFAQNLKTALIMGESRGASMAVVSESGIPIYEIAPRKVKQAIVGYGAAQKDAVAKMVQRVLNLEEQPAPDAADALGLAIALSQQVGKPFAKGPTRI